MGWKTLIVVIWILSCAALIIWSKCVPKKSRLALTLEIIISILAALGAVGELIYKAWEEPTKEQILAEKELDADRIADSVLKKLNLKEIVELQNEYRKIVTEGIKITGKDNPEDILSTLLIEEKKINTAVNENIEHLIDRNKEIAIFAQSLGELDVALDATNKILDYSPRNSFAFRERGYINHRLGRIEKAEQDILKSMELSTTDIEKAAFLNSAGGFYLRVGRLEKAAECFEAAYIIGETINNRAIKASSDLNLSDVYDKLGRTQEAECLLSRAIIEFEKIGDKKMLVAAKLNQATHYLEHAKIHEAKQRLEDLKKMAEDTNEDLLKSAVYMNLGNFYSTLNDDYLAKEYLLKAIEIDRKLKMDGALATSYGNLGIIYKNQGKLLEAEEEQTKAMILFEKLNDQQGVARSLINIGNIKLQQEDYASAKEYYEKGRNVAERTGSKRIIADSNACLSILYMEQGIFEAAEKHIQEAISIYDDTGDSYTKAKGLLVWGHIKKRAGNKDSAFEKWSDSKMLFAEIGLPHMVQTVDIELNKLKTGDAAVSDPNEVKRAYQYLVQVHKCRILNGLEFLCKKINGNKDVSLALNKETSFLCFENDVSISISDFIEKIRLYCEKNASGQEENIRGNEVELNTVSVSRYNINITFPPKTYFKPTKGGQLIAKNAHGIIEIQREWSKFSNFEMFSIDRNTLGQRGWASTIERDIGMIFQTDNEDGVHRIGFQANGGSMKIHKAGEMYKDPILEKMKIKIERID